MGESVTERLEREIRTGEASAGVCIECSRATRTAATGERFCRCGRRLRFWFLTPADIRWKRAELLGYRRSFQAAAHARLSMDRR